MELPEMNYNKYGTVEFPCEPNKKPQIELVPLLWLFESEKIIRWPPYDTKAKCDKFVKQVIKRVNPSDDWLSLPYKKVTGLSSKFLES